MARTLRVLLHLTAHGGKGLFSGAISQSAGRLRMPSPEQELPAFQFYAEQAGCKRPTDEETIACLREAPVEKLAKADDACLNFNGSGYHVWQPVLDNKVFTQYPTEALMSGNFARVPIMVGATSNETLGNAMGGTDFESVLKAMFPALTAEDVAAIGKIYPSSNFPSEESRVDFASGELLLRASRENVGAAGVKYSSAYAYRYNQPDPWSTFPAPPGAVMHAAENSMMFLGTETGINGATEFHPLNPVQTAFSQELFAYWLSFVRSGNPNTYKLASSPDWPQYSSNKRMVLQQNPQGSTTASESHVESEPEDEVHRADVIASLSKGMQA